MDRFTWAAVIGVAVLCVVGVVSVLVTRQSSLPPDLGTPEGVVTAYVVAIQEKRADDAWELLASPRAAGVGPNGDRDSFRQNVNNADGQSNRRIRVLGSKLQGETGQVEVEITTVSTAPVWFGFPSASRTATFSVRREGASWRIMAAPSVWELR